MDNILFIIQPVQKVVPNMTSAMLRLRDVPIEILFSETKGHCFPFLSL